MEIGARQDSARRQERKAVETRPEEETDDEKDYVVQLVRMEVVDVVDLS